jgi:hypothetical protein
MDQIKKWGKEFFDYGREHREVYVSFFLSLSLIVLSLVIGISLTLGSKPLMVTICDAKIKPNELFAGIPVTEGICEMMNMTNRWFLWIGVDQSKIKDSIFMTFGVFLIISCLLSIFLVIGLSLIYLSSIYYLSINSKDRLPPPPHLTRCGRKYEFLFAVTLGHYKYDTIIVTGVIVVSYLVMAFTLTSSVEILTLVDFMSFFLSPTIYYIIKDIGHVFYHHLTTIEINSELGVQLLEIV